MTTGRNPAASRATAAPVRSSPTTAGTAIRSLWRVKPRRPTLSATNPTNPNTAAVASINLAGGVTKERYPWRYEVRIGPAEWDRSRPPKQRLANPAVVVHKLLQKLTPRGHVFRRDRARQNRYGLQVRRDAGAQHRVTSGDAKVAEELSGLAVKTFEVLFGAFGINERPHLLGCDAKIFLPG